MIRQGNITAEARRDRDGWKRRKISEVKARRGDKETDEHPNDHQADGATKKVRLI